MKISKLIAELEKIQKAQGDLNVYGAGHPGEIGSKFDQKLFEVADKSDVKTARGKAKKVLRIWF